MLNLADAMPFARLLGLKVATANAREVVGEIEVRPELCTTGRIMHGGAIMAVADTVGALGAFASLPDGAKGTTTIESKTNFLASAPEGTVVRAISTAVKNGKRISVWRTAIEAADGQLIAEVTQTQLVLY